MWTNNSKNGASQFQTKIRFFEQAVKQDAVWTYDRDRIHKVEISGRALVLENGPCWLELPDEERQTSLGRTWTNVALDLVIRKRLYP